MWRTLASLCWLLQLGPWVEQAEGRPLHLEEKIFSAVQCSGPVRISSCRNLIDTALVSLKEGEGRGKKNKHFQPKRNKKGRILKVTRSC